MSFKEYLTENTKNDLEKMLDALLPTIANSPKHVQYMKDAFDKLIAGVETGKIFNVHYKDAMNILNRRFEEGWGKVEYDPSMEEWRKFVKENNIPWESFFPRMGNTASTIKALEKYAKTYKIPAHFIQSKIDYLKIFAPFKEINDTLKKNTIAGRVPNPDAVPKFQPTYSPSDAKIVETKFKEITASIRDMKIKALHNFYTNAVNSFQNIIKDIPPTDMNKYRFSLAQGPRSPWTVYKNDKMRMLIVRDFVDMKKDWLPIDNVDQVILDKATRETDDFLGAYIRKNVQKLSALVGKKPIKNIQILRATAGAYTVESELRFDFEDGARFYVINKGVYVENQAGTQFMRFPTTFHDVVKSDGTKLASPSEEKMNKEW
jgi:hypothetical protein